MNNIDNSRRINTPWGMSQTVKVIADGIIDISTAGHGGMQISKPRWAELKKIIPAMQSFTGDFWLEEDCDWALAVMAWPDLFDERYCYYAERETKRRDDMAGYIGSEQHKRLCEKASKHQVPATAMTVAECANKVA